MALNLNPENNDTSFTLDFLRALAAFAVLIGHAMSFFAVAPYLQPPRSPYIQNLAVIGFFVLSGFLIAFVLDRSQEKGIASFLIDRFARIYSSFLPAMVLIAIIAWGLQAVGKLDGDLSFSYWLSNLLMLNAYGNTICEVACLPNFLTAAHLWSLAVEWHIYLFAGFMFFGLRQKSPLLIVGAIATAWVPYVYLGTKFELNPGKQLFYMWIIGFVAYYLVSRIAIPPLAAGVLFLASLYVLRRTVIPSNEYNLPTYFWVGCAFIGIMALTQTTTFLTGRPKSRAFIKYVADFSFSLYLVHHPLQFALQKFWPDSGWSGATIAILLPIPVAIAIAHMGERRHKKLAAALKSRLIKSSKSPVPC